MKTAWCWLVDGKGSLKVRRAGKENAGVIFITKESELKARKKVEIARRNEKRICKDIPFGESEKGLLI